MNNQITPKELEQLIASHSFFSFLGPADIAELVKLMEPISVKKGDIIVTEGDIVDKVYLIAAGEAEVLKKSITKNKTEILNIANLHPGEFIGLSKVGFFALEGYRTATVQAAVDSTLYAISLEQFNDFIETRSRLYPGFKKSIEKLLRMQFIKLAVPFSLLNAEDISWLSNHLEVLEVRSGEVIFQQGDKGDKAYLIQSGKIEIKKTDTAGKVTQFTLPAGQIFGETALLTGQLRNATASVLEDCHLLAIDQKLLTTVLRHNKKTTANLEKLIKERTVISKNEKVSVTKDESGNIPIVRISDKKEHFLNLSEEEALVWAEINGKNSINDIIAIFNKQFGGNAKEKVENIVLRLINQGFIANPEKLAEPGLWNKIKKKFL